MILVVGDVMTDVIVRPHGPLVHGSDRAATIRTAPGGSGANLAAWLGHFGAAVTLAARVGAADAAAQAAALHAHGVRTRFAIDPDLPTGMLVTLLDADGERSFLTDRGAGAALCRTDLPDALLDDARLLHVSGYSLFAATPRAAVIELMRAARRRGLAVTVDAASAGFLAEVSPAAFLDWTAGADTLVANADEAALLAGSDDPATQLTKLMLRYPTAVVKRGAAGAVAASRGTDPCAAAAPCIDAVDTTGAGDAFFAAFLVARGRGAALADCLAAAVAAGATAAAHLGGRPAVRTT